MDSRHHQPIQMWNFVTLQNVMSMNTYQYTQEQIDQKSFQLCHMHAAVRLHFNICRICRNFFAPDKLRCRKIMSSALLFRKDKAVWPVRDPVKRPSVKSQEQIQSFHQGQLEAFCLHLLQFINPLCGAQSRPSFWVLGTGWWGQKKTLFFPSFLVSRRSKTHSYSIMCAGLLVSASL